MSTITVYKMAGGLPFPELMSNQMGVVLNCSHRECGPIGAAVQDGLCSPFYDSLTGRIYICFIFVSHVYSISHI